MGADGFAEAEVDLRTGRFAVDVAAGFRGAGANPMQRCTSPGTL